MAEERKNNYTRESTGNKIAAGMIRLFEECPNKGDGGYLTALILRLALPLTLPALIFYLIITGDHDLKNFPFRNRTIEERHQIIWERRSRDLAWKELMAYHGYKDRIFYMSGDSVDDGLVRFTTIPIPLFLKINN